MRYKHSEVGAFRGKPVWKFLPTNYRTKREAEQAGKRQKQMFGYLYRVRKMAIPYRNRLVGGYRVYVMAVQKRG